MGRWVGNVLNWKDRFLECTELSVCLAASKQGFPIMKIEVLGFFSCCGLFWHAFMETPHLHSTPCTDAWSRLNGDSEMKREGRSQEVIKETDALQFTFCVVSSTAPDFSLFCWIELIEMKIYKMNTK